MNGIRIQRVDISGNKGVRFFLFFSEMTTFGSFISHPLSHGATKPARKPRQPFLRRPFSVISGEAGTYNYETLAEGRCSMCSQHVAFVENGTLQARARSYRSAKYTRRLLLLQAKLATALPGRQGNCMYTCSDFIFHVFVNGRATNAASSISAVSYLVLPVTVRFSSDVLVVSSRFLVYRAEPQLPNYRAFAIPVIAITLFAVQHCVVTSTASRVWCNMHLRRAAIGF